MEAQAHASCNQRTGCYVRATAPPLAPLPRLLDCGTSTETRGNPAYDPAGPARCDGQYGQKWPAVMAVAGGQEQRSRHQPSLRPIYGKRGNPLSRREDGAPVFRSSNGSRTRDGRPANHSPRRINSAAGGASGRGSERRFAFAIMTASKKGTPRHSISYPFPFPLSLSYNRDRERGIPRKGSFPVKEPGSEPPY